MQDQIRRLPLTAVCVASTRCLFFLLPSWTFFFKYHFSFHVSCYLPAMWSTIVCDLYHCLLSCKCSAKSYQGLSNLQIPLFPLKTWISPTFWLPLSYNVGFQGRTKDRVKDLGTGWHYERWPDVEEEETSGRFLGHWGCDLGGWRDSGLLSHLLLHGSG